MSDQARSAQDALGARLLEVALREDEAASRPRRGRKRAAALLAAGVLGIAATAGAVNLISVGEPLPDRTSTKPEYQPISPGAPDIVARAPDRPLPWGVAVYTGGNGHACALAGQIRGAELGRIENGRFRAYERGTSGACGNLTRQRLVTDMLLTRGPPARSVLFGRTRASVSRLVITVKGRRHDVTPARGGGFVLAFDGLLRSEDIDVRPVDSRASGPE